jgi:hypothetical protein
MKNSNCFAENRRKLLKLDIIALAPDHPDHTQDACLFFFVSGGIRTHDLMCLFFFAAVTNGDKSEPKNATLPRRKNVTDDAKEKASKSRDVKSDDSDGEEVDKFRHKLLPESDDFKIVFISSDSSKESDQVPTFCENKKNFEKVKF